MSAVFLGFPVFIKDLGIPVTDDSAFRDQDRCIRVYGLFQQIRQILHGIKRIADVPDLIALHLSDQVADSGNPFEAGAQRETVTRIQVPVGNFAQQPFHVIYAVQFLRKGNTGNPVFRQFLNSVEPCVDLVPVQQGLFNPAAQQPPAHGCGSLVQQIQQRPFFAFPPKAFRQFKIPPCVRIQQHPVPALGKAK